MRKALVHTLLLAAFALLGGAGSVAGQQQAAADSASPRGWIGISFAYPTSVGAVDDSAASGPVVIQQVFQGSPADEAGLRPGDAIVQVDGHETDTDRFRSFEARIRSGDSVTLSVRRDGRTREVSLTADPRPTFAAAPLPPEIVVYLDSLRDAVLRRFDSLQLRMRAPDADMPPARFEPAPSLRPRRPAVAPGAVLPDDSLRLRLRSLQEELLRTWRDEQALVASAGVRQQQGKEVSDQDRSRLRDLHLRSDSLEGNLQGIYRELALRQARDVARALRRARMRASANMASPAARAPRPPVPHLVGRNYVAGAQVTAVNAGLADYFGVDQGVLVTEILEDSPAEDAGLEPGDVVVAVEGRGVPTVDALRSTLMQLRSWPAELDVVRKGDRIQLHLPR